MDEKKMICDTIKTDIGKIKSNTKTVNCVASPNLTPIFAHPNAVILTYDAPTNL